MVPLCPQKPYSLLGTATSTFTQLLSSVVPLELPVPNKPYGFCGRKATFEEEDQASLSGTFLHEQSAVTGYAIEGALPMPNSKHWFTTSFGGRCRKAMLGVCAYVRVKLQASLSGTLPPNYAVNGYATEGTQLVISAHLSTEIVCMILTPSAHFVKFTKSFSSKTVSGSSTASVLSVYEKFEY